MNENYRMRKLAIQNYSNKAAAETLSMQMSKYSIFPGLVLALWCPAVGTAQTTSPQASNESNAAAADISTLLSQMHAIPGVPGMPVIAGLVMDLPAEPNAWVVRIVLGGGFTGQYRGFIVASQGTVHCTAEIQCRAALSASELESINMLVSEPVLSKWPPTDASATPPVSVCSDCIRVWLELRHREKDGTEKLYSTTWDEVSKSSLPVEVKQIYETALSFRRKRRPVGERPDFGRIPLPKGEGGPKGRVRGEVLDSSPLTRRPSVDGRHPLPSGEGRADIMGRMSVEDPSRLWFQQSR